jgi:hypothetical protein
VDGPAGSAVVCIEVYRTSDKTRFAGCRLETQLLSLIVTERPFGALGLSADADRAHPLLVTTRG